MKPLSLLHITCFIWFSAASAVQAERCELRLGMILPLTGMSSQFGERSQKGARLAQEHAEGFMKGCGLHLSFEDSAWQSAKGVNAFLSLYTLKNINAVTTGASHISMAIAPLAAQRSIPQFAIFTSAEEFSSPEDMSIRISPRARDDVLPLLGWLASQQNLVVGLLYIGNDFGEGIASAFRAGLQERGLVIRFDERFLPDQDDFRPTLAKAKQAGVDAMLIVGLPIHYSHILRQADEIEFRPYFLSPRTAEDPLVASLGTAARRLLYSNPFNRNSDAPIMKRFIRDYFEKFGQKPDSYAAEAYASVQIAGQLWARCAGALPCIKEQLRNPEGLRTVFGTLNFDRDGNANFKEVLMRIKDGKYIVYEK